MAMLQVSFCALRAEIDLCATYARLEAMPFKQGRTLSSNPGFFPRMLKGVQSSLSGDCGEAPHQDGEVFKNAGVKRRGNQIR